MIYTFTQGNCFSNFFFVFATRKNEEKIVYLHNIYAYKTQQ